MQLVELAPVSLRDLATAVIPVPRSPGLHVSAIISDMMAKAFPEKYGTDQGDQLRENYQETGFAFEDVLGKAFAERQQVTFRPGEIVRDGVICSPDGITVGKLYTPGAGTLHTMYGNEFKCTWKSMRGFDLYAPKFLYWLYQIKAYAHVLDLREWELCVLFLNGDWKPPVPHVKRYFLTFEPHEPAEAWQQLLAHARHEGML